MSSDLVWSIIRNNSSHLVKQAGHQFSTESNNLTAKNSYKFSGLANKKALGVNLKDNNIVLTTKSVKSSNSRKPSAQTISVTLKRDIRRVARSIKNAAKGYRPDLETAALARASALFRAKRAIAKGLKPKAKRSRKHVA
eukprot:c13137_g1_i1.p1 GENE.c13137_g1_i1~~c13137_g1_i1.p1  ORF type:complete len:150 (+),score=31.25 c13137_g1_i1:36-452(+)